MTAEGSYEALAATGLDFTKLLVSDKGGEEEKIEKGEFMETKFEEPVKPLHTGSLQVR